MQDKNAKRGVAKQKGTDVSGRIPVNTWLNRQVFTGRYRIDTGGDTARLVMAKLLKRRKVA